MQTQARRARLPRCWSLASSWLYRGVGELAITMALGGVIAVLLHYKDPLALSSRKRIGKQVVTAIMQFVLISWSCCPYFQTALSVPTTR